MAGKYGTPFTESEALLAMQANDLSEVHRILREMLPGERATLRRACENLASEINFEEFRA